MLRNMKESDSWDRIRTKSPLYSNVIKTAADILTKCLSSFEAEPLEDRRVLHSNMPFVPVVVVNQHES